MGVSNQTRRVRGDRAARTFAGSAGQVDVAGADPLRPEDPLEQPVRPAVDVVADHHLVTGQGQLGQHRRRRGARTRRRSPARRPRARRRPAPGGAGSGCPSGRTPSRRAAGRSRPGRTCSSGRSAARRPRSAHRAPGRHGPTGSRATSPRRRRSARRTAATPASAGRRLGHGRSARTGRWATYSSRSSLVTIPAGRPARTAIEGRGAARQQPERIVERGARPRPSGRGGSITSPTVRSTTVGSR